MRRILVSTVLLLALVCAPLAALVPLVSLDAWAPATGVALAVAAIVLVLGRTVFSGIVWPTFAGLAAGWAALLGMQAHAHEEITLWPVPEGAASLWEAALNGTAALRSGLPPVGNVAGVGLIVAALTLLVFISAESLALGSDSPALAGLPALLLWTPQVVLRSEVPYGYALVTVAAYLLLLVVGGRLPFAWGQVAPVSLGLVTLAVVSALIVTPSLLAMPSWLGVAGPGGGSSQLDLGLDIRNDLVRGQDVPVITYAGMEPRELGPLHSHTLTTFDGSQWHEDPDRTWAPSTTLHPAGYSRMVDLGGPMHTVTIRVLDGGQGRIFLPSAPRETHVPLAYDSAADEAHSLSGADSSYLLSGQGQVSDPTFWHEQSLIPDSPDHEDALLALPETSKSDDIAALAQEITHGATSPYEKAVAIQNFLRTGSRFSYTTTVPHPVSDDAVWDFLEDGQGYCVQFATAMVVLARAAGIPARMAVGFLPGERATMPDGRSGGQITSHDAHTWPQLFLGQAGWARFEPTPSERSGPTPAFSRGLPQSVTPEVDEVPDVEARPTTAPAPDPTPTAAPAPVDDTPRSWVPLIAGAAVALAATLWWMGSRRRALKHSGRGAEEYWATALRLLRPLGLTVSAADTPSTVARRAADLELPKEALAGFIALTDSLNASRYAPDPTPVPDESLRTWLEQVRYAAQE